MDDPQTDLQEFAVKANEPSILCISLKQGTSLKNQSLNMNELMFLNGEISNDTKLFFPFQDGIRVSQSGLYRVSFFQRIFTLDQRGEFILSLLLTPGNYRKRYQHVKLEANSCGEINFSQILRINANQKVQLIISPVAGETILGPEWECSGFTIERLGS
ncbi:MAG: hypothetical protein JSS10_04525 [Verrucomicrobia bacterium]|nr:hypothetical protein [Verrucomicrobiota bacterium]